MKTLLYILSCLIICVAPASAQTVKCPYVGDLNSGTYSNSSKNYKCFSSSAAAKKDGFGKAPAPTSFHSWAGKGNFKTEVFYLKKGTSIYHQCNMGGYFGVKIYKASNNEGLDLLVNTIGPTAGDTRTYESGAVYIDISTTSQCSWYLKIK